MSTGAMTPERLNLIRRHLELRIIPNDVSTRELLAHIDTLTAQRENMRRELSESAGRNIDLHLRIGAIRDALYRHPKICDTRPDGESITCGWKHAVADIQHALEAS